MQKITPFLWFDGQAEEAAKFYTSIFKNSKILSVSRYGDAGPGPQGTVMTTTFQLEGQEFTALNGGLSTNSPKPSPSTLTVKPRPKSIRYGQSSPRAEKKVRVAG